MTSPNPKYLLKVPLPNTIRVRSRVSTYEFSGDSRGLLNTIPALRLDLVLEGKTPQKTVMGQWTRNIVTI